MPFLDVFDIKASFWAIFAVNYPAYTSGSTPYSSTTLSQRDENGLDVISSSIAKQIDSDSSSASSNVPSSTAKQLDSDLSSASSNVPSSTAKQLDSDLSSASSNVLDSNRSAAQTSSNPYRLAPSYTPVLDERLPDELKDLVSEYQNANFFILDQLIKYGGFHKEVASRSDIMTKLYYKDDNGDLSPMVVQRKQFKEHYGMRIDMPYILGSQYMKLLGSMLRSRDNEHAGEEVDNALCQIFDKLLIAIAGRAVVNDWHVALPAADQRCRDNAKHRAFLATLRNLRNLISYKLHDRADVLLVRD